MSKPILLELTSIVAKRKDLKTKVIVEDKDPNSGELRYTRNDVVGLMSLLGKMDTRIHAQRDWKSMVQIKDKLTECYLEDKTELDLSLDQASFLKLFLKELPDKEGKDHMLSDFELQTLFGIQDQLF